MVSKPYYKIIIRENDDEGTINRIIKNKKPKLLILETKESSSLDQIRMNQKTYWIAQNLMSDGWKIDDMENNYKEKKLLKIILSPK